MTQFDEDYQRGMDMLFAADSTFANLTLALGRPVPDYNIPTACVQWDGQSKQILFKMNPDFAQQLTDEQLGAVIAHETYHVVLDHLPEAADLATYPRPNVLMVAHEVLINDGLYNNLGLQLPTDGAYGAMFGPNVCGHDFSNHTTPEAYKVLDEAFPEQQPEGQGQESEGHPQQDASSGSGAGGGGKSQQKDSDKQDSDEQDQKGASKQEEQDGSGEENSEAEDAGGTDSEEDSEAAEGDSPAGEDTNGEKTDQNGLPTPKGCHGVELSPEEVEDLRKRISQAAKSLKDDLADLPQEIKEALVEMDPSLQAQASGWGLSKPQAGTVFANRVIDMNMNWFELLQRINPKLKQVGCPKPKDVWHKPHRKAMSIYPRVILPTKQELKDDDNFKKNNSKPFFIVALDLSGSIPRTLVNKLVSLVDDVPEKFIQARPVTWSNDVVEYDPEVKQLCYSGGTNIEAVYAYAERVEKELGRTPYVMVITDGQCAFSGGGGYNYYGRSQSSDTYEQKQAKVKKYWYWCAIQDRDERAIKSYLKDFIKEDNVFKLSDFTKA